MGEKECVRRMAERMKALVREKLEKGRRKGKRIKRGEMKKVKRCRNGMIGYTA